MDQAARAGFYNAVFYADLISDPTGLSLPLFLEEMFWGCAGIGLTIVLPALALSALNQAGTPEQLARWAPEMFGEPGDIKLAALAVSEPQGGSDVANLATRARKDGDEWVLDGTKMWIGNGGIADVHVVNAVVDPELGPGDVRRPEGYAGSRAAPTPGQARPPRLAHRRAELHRLPHPRRPAPRRRRQAGAQAGQGPPGRGQLGRPRDLRADPADGCGDGAGRRPRLVRVLLRVRPGPGGFGGPILENQGVSFPLADLAADIDAARLLCWRASWMAAAGVPFHMAEGSMSKLKASEVAVRAAEQAVQVCGGWGYVSDLPVEKWYRDAKLYTIFEGTSEIQRMVIGRTLGTAGAQGPLHHGLLGDDGGIGRRSGHGSLARARAGEVFLKLAKKAPDRLRELGGRLASPGR